MNVVINNSFVQATDRETLFGDEEIILVSVERDDYASLLVQLGVYKSSSEARRAGRSGEIPKGWNQLKASKLVPDLFLWNPTE